MEGYFTWSKGIPQIHGCLWSRSQSLKAKASFPFWNNVLAWDGISIASENLTTQARIKNCQDQLQWWNKNVFGHIEKQLKDKQQKLQQFDSLNTLHEFVDDIQHLRKEINDLMDRENDMWHQRSWALWMQEEDRNTKFFHFTATQRGRKNTILGLQDEFRCWNGSEEDIETIV